VVAADLDGCAVTITIEGQPVAHLKSFFAKSTGNEVSRSTGGGVVSHATQGMAFFQSGSADVLIEGKPAVRHGDLLTCNHLALMPPNTPPTPWMSTMMGPGPGQAPGSVKKTLNEGKDSIVLRFVDEVGAPLDKGRYEVKTPSGRQVTGRILSFGKVSLRRIAKGNCEVVLPQADARAAELGQRKPAKTNGEQKAYVPGSPLRLATGKEYVVVVPYTKSLWVDLPVRVDDPDSRNDEFVLESKDGSYRMVKTIADDRIRGDRHLTLEFFGLESGKSYTLTHHLGSDQPSRTVFQEIPYEEIFAVNPHPKTSFEEPTALDIDSDMWAPRLGDDQIRLAEEGEEFPLHSWPPPDKAGR
jgi:uncharacterized Zn-binding protein involved in type VI secretion